jgi:hypothetical protein
MSTTALVIVVACVVVVLLAVAAVLVQQANRRRPLRQQFGPEYDRTVEATGGTKEAEIELRARTQQRDKLNIRPLSAAQRDTYEQDWRQVQADFVDVPVQSLSRADTLVLSVMVGRGYPMQDFDQQADLISVDHPIVVDHYRRAHGIYLATQSGPISTEQLRQAFISYRALFEELLDERSSATR